MTPKTGTEQSKLIPELQYIQRKYKHLPAKQLKRLARRLSLTLPQIYAVATFYNQFRLTPLGKHLIQICHGTACHVRGAEKIDTYLEDTLNIKVDETTPDNKFTFIRVACLGCCSLAPCMMIDQTVYARLTEKKVKEIIKTYPD
jgi:NADH:ubiquinone oxidoreductase subunit E